MIELGALVLTPVLGFVGSWGGVRAQLKSIRDDLSDTKRDVRDVRRRVDSLSDRVTAIKNG